MSYFFLLKPREKNLILQEGFTFIELLLSLGVVAILLGLAGATIIRPQTQSSLDGEVLKIVADIKSQQMKAMVGDIEEGSSPQPYGIYIQPNQYTLFQGSVFNSLDANNFIIAFPSTVQVSGNSLPSGILIFNRRSGEVSRFSSPVSFTLQDTINLNTKTVTMQNIFGSLAIAP